MKKTLWWVLTAICIVLSPYIFYLADLERGYNATGGEAVIFFIPFLVWCIDDTWRVSKKGVVDFEVNDCNGE